MLTIRDTTIEDLMFFYNNVRPLDKVEFSLMSGIRLADARLLSLGDTQVLVDEDDRVYALGGIEGNFIWLLCTTLVEEHPITFLKACRAYFKSWIGDRVLTNFVWENNVLHIRWLKWLGAVFTPEQPIKYFRQFVLNGKDW